MKKNLRSTYKTYLSTTEDPVDVKTYTELNNLYMKFLVYKGLKGYEVTLPARLGTLAIVGRKSKVRFNEGGDVVGLAPDWVSTKKLWEENPDAKAKRQRIFHTNAHSDGYRYKWHWGKKKIMIENKTLYALRMVRSNKRAVNTLVNKGVQFITKN